MDQRTKFEVFLWDVIGPPLYYCEECKLQVVVKPKGLGNEPEIIRDKRCNHTGQIIAPRKATLVGKGGASMLTKSRVSVGQILSGITKRSV